MNTSDEVIRIIKKLRKERGLSVEELSRRVGIAKSTQSRYESGQRKFPINDIGKYAEVLNTSTEHLLGIDKPNNIYPESPRTLAIPILGKIACGDPITAEENIKGYTYESPENLPKGNLFCLEAAGDSMYPTVPNGSLVTIREQATVESGEIAAVLINGNEEAVLKRIKKHGETVFLISDNTNYDPILVTEENPAKIIGKAVRVTKNL